MYQERATRPLCFPSLVDKQLNTVLGSWSELKHDTILYAKQVYAELGGGPPPPPPERQGLRRTSAEFYAPCCLTAMTARACKPCLLDELDLAT